MPGSLSILTGWLLFGIARSLISIGNNALEITLLCFFKLCFLLYCRYFLLYLRLRQFGNLRSIVCFFNIIKARSCAVNECIHIWGINFNLITHLIYQIIFNRDERWWKMKVLPSPTNKKLFLLSNEFSSLSLNEKLTSINLESFFLFQKNQKVSWYFPIFPIEETSNMNGEFFERRFTFAPSFKLLRSW